MGINVASLGPFFEADEPVNGDNVNGWPLFQRRQTFATIAGFWDQQPTTNMTNFEWLNQYGGESVISGIPHWSGLSPDCKGSRLDASTDASQITGYSSTWDFKKGTMTWKYTWTPPDCPALDMTYSLLTHKLNIHQAAVQMSVTPSDDVYIDVHDMLHGDCATRSQFLDKGSMPGSSMQWTSVHPDGMPDVGAYVYSAAAVDNATTSTPWTESTSAVFGRMTNQSSTSQSTTLSVTAGQTSNVWKYVGVASSDAIDEPQAAACDAAMSAMKTGYTKMLRSHIDEWANIVTPDSIGSWRMPNGTLPNDPDIVEQQILAVTNPYAILQQTIGENAYQAAGNNTRLMENSITVGGLGSDSYGGLVFWDVEVWMQPGIVLSFPDSMRQVANYRTSRRGQALENVRSAGASSQNETVFSPNSAIYSWTSGRAGNCTGTGPCFDYEYHINGDIALELENYWLVTGDTQTFREDYFPTYESAAQVYSDLLYMNETTETYMLRNATDPDEFANAIDNPLFTMLLIKTLLTRANAYRSQFGMEPKETWRQQASAIEIAANDTASIHLEYSTMNGTISVKQADVVLIYDLLAYTNSTNRAGDLAYYAGKQSLDGPGMTYGVFSIVSSEDSTSGCAAYTYDLWSSQPYARAPWFQYSEQLNDDYATNGGFHPAYPFLTGMGGANRVPMYGYLGLRLRQDSLNVNPTLPPQIPHLNYRTFYWQGHAINATANATHTTLARLSRSLPAANPAYAENSIPVTIGKNPNIQNLTSDTPLYLPNRRPHLNKTVQGNLAQCLPASSNRPYAPGQFPLSAVDGAASTKWQPASPAPATLTVNLGDAGETMIQGFEFDWAQAPPVSYFVEFADSPGGGRRMVHMDGDVEVSAPYDEGGVAAVVPYRSNTSSVRLEGEGVMGGRYAFLTIEGQRAFPGVERGSVSGGSVAEWAVLGAS